MRGALWTDEMETQLRELAAQGKTADEIGEIFGMSRNAVSGKGVRIGVKFVHRMHRTTFDDEMIERLKAMVEEGRTLRQIATALERNHKSVRKHVMRLFPDRARNRVVHMNPHPRHRVTDEERAELINSVDTADIVLMEEMRDYQCRFPITDTVPFKFCGKKRERGVYCEVHWTVAHQHAAVA